MSCSQQESSRGYLCTSTGMLPGLHLQKADHQSSACLKNTTAKSLSLLKYNCQLSNVRGTMWTAVHCKQGKDGFGDKLKCSACYPAAIINVCSRSNIKHPCTLGHMEPMCRPSCKSEVLYKLPMARSPSPFAAKLPTWSDWVRGLFGAYLTSNLSCQEYSFHMLKPNALIHWLVLSIRAELRPRLGHQAFTHC